MSGIVLRIDNVNSTLFTTDQDLKDKLAEKLRFRPKGYFHVKAFKKKKWDGWTYFFDPKKGTFLTGLLPEVKLFLRFLKKEFTVVDNRGEFKWAIDSIGQDFLKPWFPPTLDPFSLYDYQPDLVNQCIKHNRGIVQAPTNAGKTFILVSLLKCLPPKTPTLFLTKSSGLVHQNWEEMKLWGVPNLGRWYGDYHEPNYVMCCTSHQKTFESLHKLLPKFKVLIVDEVHDCMSDTPMKAYMKMTGTQVRIGISATPFKWDKKKIYDVHKWQVKGNFGPLFKTTTTETGVLTTKDLQKRGISADSECHVYPITHPNLAYEPFQDAVKLGIEQNFGFHEIVARLVKTRCQGRTLIVVDRIEQGNYLSQLIPGSEFISGADSLKDRAPVLENLKAGEGFVAIVMKQIITAGINIKIHNLVNASGGEGAHNIIQLMGRGLRTAKDKSILKFYDFLFLINDYLRKHSEWRIDVLRSEGHNVLIHESIDF